MEEDTSSTADFMMNGLILGSCCHDLTRDTRVSSWHYMIAPISDEILVLGSHNAISVRLRLLSKTQTKHVTDWTVL